MVLRSFLHALVAASLAYVSDCQTLQDTLKTKVHFVAHSHMDAGWLRTYDQYFDEKVNTILRTVTERLHSHPDERYTIGDIAFFRKYYEKLPPAGKSKV